VRGIVEAASEQGDVGVTNKEVEVLRGLTQAKDKEQGLIQPPS
jgi:hypothetical protein